MPGKLVIPFIPAGNGHDCTGTITSQYIFRYPNGNFPAIEWINGISTGKYTADLFFCHSLPFTAAFYIIQVFIYCCCLYCRFYFIYKVQFRSDDHEVNTKNGIGPGGIHSQFLFMSFNVKINFGTRRFTYPVGLHFFHGFTELDLFQSFEQMICIFSDPQVPLP